MSSDGVLVKQIIIYTYIELFYNNKNFIYEFLHITIIRIIINIIFLILFNYKQKYINKGPNKNTSKS